MTRIRSVLAVVAAAVGSVVAPAGQAPPDRPLAPIELTGTTLRTYDAADASQGVAAGLQHFFAVDNAVLAKHDIRSGRLLDRWAGPPDGPIRHMNS